MTAVTATARDAPAPEARIRVMLVDDAVVVRGMVARILEREDDMEIVHSVVNGEEAIKAIKRAPVDFILLDVEMPVMDGLTALPLLIEAAPDTKVIMNSTLTHRNASVTIRALSKGASDFVAKPSASGGLAARDFADTLIAKIRGLSGARGTGARAVVPVAGAADDGIYHGAEIVLRGGLLNRPAVLAVGASTGGPPALCRFFAGLGRAPSLPIVLTQHMPPTFTAILAEHIKEASGIDAVEAAAGSVLVPGRIHVAPGDYHMTVGGTPAVPVVRLNQNEPENFCRPAVDPMLRSLAALYGGRVLVVILSGMGHDGLNGCAVVVDKGGTVIAQDEATSVVWGMPGAVATKGLCREVLPLEKIGPRINRLLQEHGL